MARSLRLSLARRQLRVLIELCSQGLSVQRAAIDALVLSDAEAQAEYLAIRGELSPRGRLFHPVARRAMRTKLDVLHARRDMRELELLQERLRSVLEKES